MKTYLFAVICLVFTTTIFAQSKLEKVKNSDYLINVSQKDTPQRVSKLQNIVANYNIQDNEVFEGKTKSTYDVVFEETNGSITATYNTNGNIIKTVEKFRDLKLPYVLAKEIFKQNPSWSLKGNTQVISYDEKNGSIKVYSITIQKGGVKKTLKYKMENLQDQNSYLVLNNN